VSQMSAGKMQMMDVRNDHGAHVALGEMALRDGHKWFIFYAVLFFIAGVALLASSTTFARMLGVGALAAAVGIIVYRVRYWRYVRANENRLAALGKERIAVAGAGGPGGFGFGGGFGLGAGAELGGALARGVLGRM
jgi:hypothetical protein